MKIIFMGTPDFSTGILEALIAAGHEITLVVSQPDKPKGRGHDLVPTPVKATALRHELPVFQPTRIRAQEAEDRLRETEADVIIVAAFGQIIPSAILHMKQYGCINVHASLLPKYRGAAPIQWAVIDGEAESGVTIMQMDEGLDTGDMLLQEKLTLDPKETGGSLFDRISTLGAKLCVEALDKLVKGELTPVKQGETTTKYAAMLTKDMGRLDFTRSAAELERLIRGLNPWPSAYTVLDGKTLKIWDAEVVETEETTSALTDSSGAGSAEGDFSSPAQPGTVIAVTKKDFTVACGEGALRVTELQLQGKKRMDTAAFLRGYHLEAGVLLSGEQE